jgi:acyl carrier protein
VEAKGTNIKASNMTTTQTTQKTASKQDIKDAAIELMKQNGTTTNLDIKNYLRAKDFWVSQNEVSQTMSTIASEENWDRTWNGTYNTWSIPAPATTDDSNDSGDTTNVIVTANPASADKALEDVITAIASKLGIYKQAINKNSNLQEDLGFIDRDYSTIGQVFGKDIKDCKTVQDIVNAINA